MARILRPPHRPQGRDHSSHRKPAGQGRLSEGCPEACREAASAAGLRGGPEIGPKIHRRLIVEDLVRVEGKTITATSYAEFVESLHRRKALPEPANHWATVAGRKPAAV